MTINISTEDQKLENLYIFLMDLVVKKYHQIASQALRDHHAGITVDQWVILKQISENTGASQSEIANSAVKDAPTTTRIIDQLLHKKLVQKQHDPDDRRKYRVFITSEGSRLIADLLPVVLEYRKIPVSGFQDNEMTALIGLLHRMLNNMALATNQVIV